MEAVLSDSLRQLELQHRQVEEQQKSAWQHLLHTHEGVVSRLEAENADLRAQLAVAGCATRISQSDQFPAELTPELSQQVAIAMRPADRGRLSQVAAVETTGTEGNFPGWASILFSQAVQLLVIADDESLPLVVHEAVLQRSPYFQARLAVRWSESHAEDNAIPLRLPPGCPAAAATVLFQHLYMEDEKLPEGRLGSSAIFVSLAARLKAGEAAVAIGAAQLAEMLLLDDLASQLSRIAQDLIASPDEVKQLQTRFIALPGIVTKACQAVQRAPAAQLKAHELSMMLRGSAQSAAARPNATAVLAAACEAGCGKACKQAVISALEAMPFRIPQTPENAAEKLRINRVAFEWLWELVEDYVLVPGCVGAEGAEDSEASTCGTLLTFFTSLARVQEVHSSARCPGPSGLFDETAVPLRLAFGAYLQHLAASAQCQELKKAVRIGASSSIHGPVTHRSQSCTISYPNLLRFGSWSSSQHLLPHLLRAAAPARAVIISALLELPPEGLAELVDDKLLEALGPDAAEVCNRLTKEPEVLAQWVSRQRLLALPLLAQRRLCTCLAPQLGSLHQDISGMVVQVLAGSSKQGAQSKKDRRGLRHGAVCKEERTRFLLVMALSFLFIVLCTFLMRRYMLSLNHAY